MRLRRTKLVPIALIALLAGCLVAVMPGPAKAAAQLMPRRCTSDTNPSSDILRGDGLRKLSVCSRGWVDAVPASSTRGVVELHTYAKNGGQWVDSRSQSITINVAGVDKYTGSQWQRRVTWGQDAGGNCRVNGPGGSVGCSVPNTDRVAFYGPGIVTDGSGALFQNWAISVSWRDDQGSPHTADIHIPPPNGPPLASPPWHA